MVMTTVQLHTTNSELRFCLGSNPTRNMSEICDGEDLWPWSRLEIRLNVFPRSIILQRIHQLITVKPQINNSKTKLIMYDFISFSLYVDIKPEKWLKITLLVMILSPTSPLISYLNGSLHVHIPDWVHAEQECGFCPSF